VSDNCYIYRALHSSLPPGVKLGKGDGYDRIVHSNKWLGGWRGDHRSIVNLSVPSSLEGILRQSVLRAGHQRIRIDMRPSRARDRERFAATGIMRQTNEVHWLNEKSWDEFVAFMRGEIAKVRR
jgi:hypothetical protein